jgi:hypothetical protein
VFKFSGLVGLRFMIIRISALVNLNSRNFSSRIPMVLSLYGKGFDPRGDGASWK